MKIQRGNKEPLIKGETIQFYRRHFGFSLSRTPLKPGVNAGAPAGVNSSCSTGGTCLVTLVTNTVISHEGGNVNMVNLKFGFCFLSSICMFCRSLFVPFLLFLLTILLSVLLRFTDSAYPLGIFKSSLGARQPKIFNNISTI
jgi:hypothetical protein